MNREYNSRVSSKKSERLLKNVENTTGDYFFLPHPVYTVWSTTQPDISICTPKGWIHQGCYLPVFGMHYAFPVDCVDTTGSFWDNLFHSVPTVSMFPQAALIKALRPA